MTHLANRPHRNNSIDRLRNRSTTPRPLGGKALGGVEVQRPGANPNHEISGVGQIQSSIHAAVGNQLHRLKDQNFREHGTKLPLDADTVYLAYLGQRSKLEDTNVTDDMTTSQLTSELMAKAVLFAPTVSDALRNNDRYENKRILSEYNDMIAEIALSLPEKLSPRYKPNMIEAIRLESTALNRDIRHSSEISGKSLDSGQDALTEILGGVQSEVAMVKGMRNDPTLNVKVPMGTESDMAGIDMIVERPEDGKSAFIDSKGHGAYIGRIKKLTGMGPREWLDDSQVGPYYYVGMHELGKPHYLVNTEKFGDIPADGFEYTPEGQATLLKTIHELLDE